MLDWTAEEIAAIQSGTVTMRDLVWVIARKLDGSGTQPFGFSTLVRNLDIPVRDGLTGAVVARPFRGVGRAFKVGTIVRTADLTVRTVDIELPAIDATAAAMLRGHNIRNAPVQIYRLLLNPDTGRAIAAARARFVGWIGTAPIPTPAAGGVVSSRIACVSATRELTEPSTDVRSHESQLARSGGTDHFYADTAVVGDWEVFWGKAGGKAESDGPRPAGPGTGRFL